MLILPNTIFLFHLNPFFLETFLNKQQQSVTLVAIKVFEFLLFFRSLTSAFKGYLLVYEYNRVLLVIFFFILLLLLLLLQTCLHSFLFYSLIIMWSLAKHAHFENILVGTYGVGRWRKMFHEYLLSFSNNLLWIYISFNPLRVSCTAIVINLNWVFM